MLFFLKVSGTSLEDENEESSAEKLAKEKIKELVESLNKLKEVKRHRKLVAEQVKKTKAKSRERYDLMQREEHQQNKIKEIHREEQSHNKIEEIHPHNKNIEVQREEQSHSKTVINISSHSSYILIHIIAFKYI